MAIKIEIKKDDFKEKEQIGPIWIARVILSKNAKNKTVEALEQSFKYEPQEEDYTEMVNNYLNIKKNGLLKKIEEYDNSDNVNAFKVNGTKAWLDKATRVGLVNSLSIEKENGVENTTLYLNGVEITIGVDKALELIKNIEMYALECYRQTEAHKKAVNNLETIAEADAYDITTGYPEIIEIEI